MSLASLPASLRTAAAKTAVCQRPFHTSSSAKASVLFALGALSNSRETAHFNKISGLPRYEHSPPLKIIKTSEVDAHPLPTPTRPAPPSSPWRLERSSTALQIWDEKALKIGRVFLSNQARQSNRLRHAMARMKRKQAVQDALVKRERLSWQQERSRLQNDLRAAVIWILASIGVATALAAWRFFPGVAEPRTPADLGRKIAARASTAMPLPAAVTSEKTTTLPASPPVAAASGGTELVHAISVSTSKDTKSSWLKGLFWKQQSSS